MQVYYNNEPMYIPRPLFTNREIYVAIDSSKTNTAIAVGTNFGTRIGIIEIDGSKDGTANVDTLVLAYNQRKFLSTVFEGSIIVSFGIEDIITKKSDNKYGAHGALGIHNSRFKITAIFMSLISFFQDNHGIIQPRLLNNQAWKRATLPEADRKRSVHKGSKEYLGRMNAQFSGFSDDATDALMMLEYMYILDNVMKGEAVIGKIKCTRKYSLSIQPSKPRAKKVFIFNPELDLRAHADYMAMNTEQGFTSCCSINVEQLENRTELFNLIKVGTKFEKYSKYVYLTVVT